jgi:Fic family protein
MYTEISQFEPLFPEKISELEDLALKVHESSAKLAGRFPAATLNGIAELLKIVNSYYSNLIEGHNTHPVDIQRAMRKDYSADQDKRDLQTESLIHIELQKKIIERLSTEPDLNVASAEFIRWIHREFYAQMPERLRWAYGEKKREWVEDGEFRRHLVQVGSHLPPAVESIDDFLRRFEKFYDPSRMHGLRPLVALAAAHHRLMWIHPFLDGNGRVARLFTDAYFYRMVLPGYGLWNVSRGLARSRDSYRAHLAQADYPRESDLDGRGNLSNRTLTEFCRFFLETCLDQAEFMNSLLALNEFLKRIEKYVEMRKAGMVVDETGKRLSPLHARAAAILKETAVRGEITRGEVFQIIEMSERTGRNVLKTFLDEGLLVTNSQWHRSNVRLGFPAQAAGYWFPTLFPNEIREK